MINIIVALKPEARPFIEHFGLVRVAADSPTRVYEGSGLALAVSGIGKGAAIRAVSALAVHCDQLDKTCWLNLGLAGHRDHEVGEAFLATSVEDAGNGETWQIHQLAGCSLPGAVVMTVAEPERSYPEDVLYEMEASGFMSAVSRLSRPDLAQVLKVVSDNRKRPVSLLTPSLATELMSLQVPVVEQLLGQMSQMI